jgi:tetratricopeptide (TPR) repeat protein
MKRIFLLLLLFIGLAFAQSCGDYIKDGDRHLQGGVCSYPHCFSAAEYYKTAADCYKSVGDSGAAMKYYADAAGYFVDAAENLLVKGGDNQLRGQCYEFAADSYAEIGLTDRASQYYQEALIVYRDYGLMENFNALSAKLAIPIQPGPTPTGYVTKDTGSWGPPTLTVVFAAGVLIVLFLFRRRGSPPKPAVTMAPREAPREAPRGQRQEFAPAAESTTEPERAERQDASLSAKEKMRRRIRERHDLE